MLIDEMVPVPVDISRRAWDVAVWLRSLHSIYVEDDGMARWLQQVVVETNPDKLGWSQCAVLFELERLHKALPL